LIKSRHTLLKIRYLGGSKLFKPTVLVPNFSVHSLQTGPKT